MPNESEKRQQPGGVNLEGLNGLFSGLGSLMQNLGELAEKGEQLRRSGEVDFGTADKPGKAVMGVNVRFGVGDDGRGVAFEPFGNVKQDEDAGTASVSETTEPIVDVMKSQRGVQLIAEMPGVGREEITCEANGDIFTIEAESPTRRYRKEVLLPRAVAPDSVEVSLNNGIVEFRANWA